MRKLDDGLVHVQPSSTETIRTCGRNEGDEADETGDTVGDTLVVGRIVHKGEWFGVSQDLSHIC